MEECLGGKWETAICATGVELGYVTTCAVGAIFYCTIHFMADHAILTVD